MSVETAVAIVPFNFAEAEARGDEDQVIDGIVRVTADLTSRIKDVELVLRQTKSAKIRNTAVIALVDMNAKAAIDTIIEMLRRPALSREAGTLIYALDELGAAIPLDVAVGLIENGSYEARAETLLLLKNGRIGADKAEIRIAAIRQLTILRDVDNRELAEAAAIALDAIGHRPAA